VNPSRLRVLVAAFVVLSVVLSLRLGYWQVWRRDELVAQARAQVRQNETIPAERGTISDRHGRLLATNGSLKSIYAVPDEIPDRAAVASRLGAVLGDDPRALQSRLESGAEWLFVGRRLPEEQIARVSQLRLPGIGTQPEPTRMYPNDRLAAAILGFVNHDGVGQYGVEGYHDAALRGLPGRLEVDRDPASRALALGLRELLPPIHGADVALTIDLVVQSSAERELDRAIKAEKAKGGTIVVIDPDTGAIVALASAPGFDPNGFRKADPETFRNRAVAWTYEPGSTMKAITVAAALEDRAIDPWTTYDDRGFATVGGRILRNAQGKSYGRLNVSGILEKSANAGAAFVAQRLGAERLHHYLREFGFGAPTGVDLAAEASGLLRPLAEWYPVDVGTASFGQGVAITPLQLAAAYAAIANGGTLYRPYVVSEIRGPRGTTRVEPQAVRRVISPGTAATVREMLVNTIDRGIAQAASLRGYSVAGKTGTSQIASPDGRYIDDEYISSFVGITPAHDPRFVCVVVLERPESRLLGTLTAMSAFKGVAQDLLHLARIEPDRVR
jgi:cell division protein FtsI (penicillin-binding protein 3)